MAAMSAGLGRDDRCVERPPKEDIGVGVMEVIEPLDIISCEELVASGGGRFNSVCELEGEFELEGKFECELELGGKLSIIHVPEGL